MESKKQKVIEEIFKISGERNDFIFDNHLVKNICLEIGFWNHFDMTKLDI